MRMSEEVRVLLIGAGIVSRHHVYGYERLRGIITIAGVVDREPTRAESLANRLGVPWATSWEEALAWPKVDAVDICLPHTLHLPAVTAALAAGKHVLCEKPLALSVHDIRTMAAAAERAGRVLMVAENFRYFAPVEQAQAWLAEGRLGKIALARVTYLSYLGGPYLETAWRFDPQELGGGVVIDSGIHFLDMAHWLFGPLRLPARDEVWLATLRPDMRAEDVAVFQAYAAEGGFPVQFVMSWATPAAASTPILEVYGNLGSLHVFYNRAVYTSETERSVVEVLSEDAYSESFRHELQHFAECIRSGRQPRTGPREAEEDLTAVLHLYGKAVARE